MQQSQQLCQAVAQGNTQRLRVLLRYGRVDINARDKTGANALMYCVWGKHVDICKVLINHSVQPDAATLKICFDHLQLHRSDGRAQTIASLLKAAFAPRGVVPGAHTPKWLPKLDFKRRNGAALKRGKKKKTKAKSHKGLLRKLNPDGERLINAVRLNEKDLVEQLLEVGAPVDYIGSSGMSAAQHALYPLKGEAPSQDIVILLLTHGAKTLGNGGGNSGPRYSRLEHDSPEVGSSDGSLSEEPRQKRQHRARDNEKRKTAKPKRRLNPKASRHTQVAHSGKTVRGPRTAREKAKLQQLKKQRTEHRSIKRAAAAAARRRQHVHRETRRILEAAAGPRMRMPSYNLAGPSAAQRGAEARAQLRKEIEARKAAKRRAEEKAERKAKRKAQKRARMVAKRLARERAALERKRANRAAQIAAAADSVADSDGSSEDSISSRGNESEADDLLAQESDLDDHSVSEQEHLAADRLGSDADDGEGDVGDDDSGSDSAEGSNDGADSSSSQHATESPLGLFGSKAYQDAMSKIVSVGIDDDYGAELPPTPDSEASREREEAQPEPTSEFESEDEMESKDELEDSSVFNDSQSDSVASDDDVDRPDSQRSTAKRAKAHVKIRRSNTVYEEEQAPDDESDDDGWRWNEDGTKIDSIDTGH